MSADMPTPEASADVLVLGAGPVGLFAAALLAESGARVTVLEARLTRPPGSQAIGLHPPALAALDALTLAGEPLGARIAREGVRVFAGRAIFYGADLGAPLLDARLALDVPGSRYRHVVTLPQYRVVSLLERALAERAGVTILRGFRAGRITRTGERMRVIESVPPETAAAPRTWEARFILGADGARGAARAQAHARIGTRVSRHRYVMGDAPDRGDLGPVATLIFHPEGVLESFPLPGNRRRWVAHLGRTDPRGDPAATLCALVGRRGGEAPALPEISDATFFGTRRGVVSAMTGPGIALLGDAAHEISPIGGQGMNLGLLDAHALLPGILAAARGDSSEPLRAAARIRVRRARLAAAIAEANASWGAPASGPGLRVRAGMARIVLATPALSRLAARVFTMQIPRPEAPRSPHR
ncbi:FAD-dependent oxidoreductase [Mycetocola spongiae]|uniref:FAD-dependent oxidoreductase n=1 Tax=Mycetocola spongiae TaxID=2859226 RepID=UPI001CF0FD08|nr:NAD(P)/FAD-dependent oxidoreductase [Mycetocola spongiae]UCR89374.1 FAD-dependent monooxygenase [Mycetocola spongiae]